MNLEALSFTPGTSFLSWKTRTRGCFYYKKLLKTGCSGVNSRWKKAVIKKGSVSIPNQCLTMSLYCHSVLQIIQENKHKNLCVSVVLVLSLLTCKSTESTDLVYHNAIYISKKSLKKRNCLSPHIKFHAFDRWFYLNAQLQVFMT